MRSKVGGRFLRVENSLSRNENYCVLRSLLGLITKINTLIIFKMFYDIYMENLNKIIGNNLTYLRKKAGLTQLEFGEKFSYSDKTVSKWEQGDVVPSVEVLYDIAEFYGVSVDFILNVHNTDADFYSIVKKTPKFVSKLAIISMIVMLLLTIAITIHVAAYFDLRTWDPELNRWWCAYLWFIPTSFLLISFFSIKTFKSRKMMIAFISCFVWTILLAAYITFLYKGNYWFLFFVGVPIQAALILFRFIK